MLGFVFLSDYSWPRGKPTASGRLSAGCFESMDLGGSFLVSRLHATEEAHVCFDEQMSEDQTWGCSARCWFLDSHWVEIKPWGRARTGSVS